MLREGGFRCMDTNCYTETDIRLMFFLFLLRADPHSRKLHAVLFGDVGKGILSEKSVLK